MIRSGAPHRTLLALFQDGSHTHPALRRMEEAASGLMDTIRGKRVMCRGQSTSAPVSSRLAEDQQPVRTVTSSSLLPPSQHSTFSQLSVASDLLFDFVMT